MRQRLPKECRELSTLRWYRNCVVLNQSLHCRMLPHASACQRDLRSGLRYWNKRIRHLYWHRASAWYSTGIHGKWTAMTLVIRIHFQSVATLSATAHRREQNQKNLSRTNSRGKRGHCWLFPSESSASHRTTGSQYLLIRGTSSTLNTERKDTPNN